jgi:hypothetical protein
MSESATASIFWFGCAAPTSGSINKNVQNAVTVIFQEPCAK